MMTYEIKANWTRHDGKEVKPFDEIATTFEMATKDGLNAIKFLKENKTRFTWIEIPNEYQMTKYFKSFELTICEATTGKNIYKITK